MSLTFIHARPASSIPALYAGWWLASQPTAVGQPSSLLHGLLARLMCSTTKPVSATSSLISHHNTPPNHSSSPVLEAVLPPKFDPIATWRQWFSRLTQANGSQARTTLITWTLELPDFVSIRGDCVG
ncbi:hypothetical protein CGRA01v4_11366 [Colletotrichum graminicola]|nr:hypothetical protein CGRA01v4_11366 [Colletotrichum graminicola]